MAKIRIEYVRLIRGATPVAGVFPVSLGGAQSLTVGNVSATVTAPAFPADQGFSGGVYARVTALDGAADVWVADSATASETSGSRVDQRADIYVPIASGQQLAAIQAADPSPTPNLYASPDGRRPMVVSNMGVLFSDGFGGSSLDATKWDVYDGGLGAVTQTAGAQAAMGSGVTGITYGVANSILTVTMPATANAELWLLGKPLFAGSEDLKMVAYRSAPRTTSSFFFGLVEVDPITGYPMLNPNLAGEFTNRGGVDLGKTTSLTAVILEACEDSSPVVASVSGAVSTSSLSNSYREWDLEFHAEDVFLSATVPNASSGRDANTLRVSTQVPNDAKVYKLLMRFRNIGVNGATTYNIDRALVVTSQELRLEMIGGRGDNNPNKAIAANITNTPGSYPTASAVSGTADSRHKLISAASVNATSVKATAGRLIGGQASNFTASVKFVKFYNLAAAPNVGTDTPVMTFTVGANASISFASMLSEYGALFGTGIAYALTGAVADSDTTAVAAGDLSVNLIYV